MYSPERRKFMRFDAALNASYEVAKDAGRGRSVVKNLSREGVQILADRELAKGTEVGLHMNVPGDNVPVYASAQVAWSSRRESGSGPVFATGMKFITIDRYDKARLLDYVYSQWLKFLKKEV
jgi:c-di-GMP-binding flagellar brake protein YcgR